MKNLHDLYQKILTKGVRKTDRTGTGTLSLFGEQLRFDLAEGFPLQTSKFVSFKNVAVELLWFLRAEENLDFLHQHGVHIWDENVAAKGGTVGRIYGMQWRGWQKFKIKRESELWEISDGERGWPTATIIDHIDQIQQVIDELRRNPDSRRLCVSAWNPADIPEMCLPPCHPFFQFNVADGRLSCMVTMRSSDTFLGLPYNIASYALLTHLVAQVTGLEVGELVMSLGDTHLYLNHLDAVHQLLSRHNWPAMPTLKLKPEVAEINDFKLNDLTLENYKPLPAIKAPMSV